MNRVISGLVLMSITALMVLFPGLEKSDQVVRFDKSRILLYIVRFFALRLQEWYFFQRLGILG